MPEIESFTLSTSELRSMVLAIEVLREIRKDEASTLSNWVPKSNSPIINDFQKERQLEYAKTESHLAVIQAKLEQVLAMREAPSEEIGHERPEERAAAKQD